MRQIIRLPLRAAKIRQMREGLNHLLLNHSGLSPACACSLALNAVVNVYINVCIYVLVPVHYGYGKVSTMAYEVFRRTSARVDTPTLSITPDGRMIPNAAAFRILLAAGARHVLLLWDKDNQRLAIKATQKGNKNAFAVSVGADGRSGGIRAKSFLSHIGWSAHQRERLPAVWDEKQKMFEIDLPSSYVEPKKVGNPK